MSQTDERRFHPEHLWVLVEGEEGVIGVTDFAQAQLGEVTVVEIPDVGETVAQGENMGAIESAKTASDLIPPVSGVVTAVNMRLAGEPWIVNDAPYGEGWLLRVRLSDPAELDGLLDEPGYLGGLE